MPDLPNLDWPVRLVTLPDGTVDFATVEQDTDPERRAAAAVAACTPKGHREDDPEYGVTQLVFQSGPIDTDQLAADLRASDDRLDLTASETFDLADAMTRTVTVDVDSLPPTA